jgi:exonuclease III
LDAKKEWNKHFEVYIRELDKKKPVIWTGDLNVAPTEMGKLFSLYARANTDSLPRPYEREKELE